MKKLIQRIRRQPERVRRHITHVFIAACAVILILLWVYSLGTTLSNPDTQTKIGEDLAPISSLKDNITSQWQNNQ